MSGQVDLGKQQLWLERVQRGQCGQRSRLTIRDFCARHHLSEPNFYCWKHVLAERGLLPTAAATPPRPAARPTTPLFVAATLANATGLPQPLEIAVRGGLAVRVGASFDAAKLRSGCRRTLQMLRPSRSRRTRLQTVR
jgi:hypothetical protein